MSNKTYTYGPNLISTEEIKTKVNNDSETYIAWLRGNYCSALKSAGLDDTSKEIRHCAMTIESLNNLLQQVTKELEEMKNKNENSN